MSFCVTIFDTIENPAENDSCFLATTKNLTLNKGSSYRISFICTKNGGYSNITGYTARGQIRPSQSSNVVLLNMSTSNLLLKIDPINSRIILNLPESFTRSVKESLVYYDIELLNGGGESSKILQGLITLIPEVSI